MLARPTEQRIIDCPDCDSTGKLASGLLRCRLCGGEAQIVITVLVGAAEDEDGGEWEAVANLRAERMPDLFGPNADADAVTDHHAIRNGRSFSDQKQIEEEGSRTFSLADLRDGKGSIQ
jgi:RecJ-like exonuclease